MSANNCVGRRKHPQASEDLLLRLSPVIRKASERYAVDEDHADDLFQDCLVHIALKLQGIERRTSNRSRLGRGRSLTTAASR